MVREKGEPRDKRKYSANAKKKKYRNVCYGQRHSKRSNEHYADQRPICNKLTAKQLYSIQISLYFAHNQQTMAK